MRDDLPDRVSTLDGTGHRLLRRDARQDVTQGRTGPGVTFEGALHLVDDAISIERLDELGYETLDALVVPEYLAIETPGWEGILKHGVYHTRKGLGVDESVMWGEFFFLEAVSKALGGEVSPS